MASARHRWLGSFQDSIRGALVRAGLVLVRGFRVRHFTASALIHAAQSVSVVCAERHESLTARAGPSQLTTAQCWPGVMARMRDVRGKTLRAFRDGWTLLAVRATATVASPAVQEVLHVPQ
jgi:hypothetical protein